MNNAAKIFSLNRTGRNNCYMEKKNIENYCRLNKNIYLCIA